MYAASAAAHSMSIAAATIPLRTDSSPVANGAQIEQVVGNVDTRCAATKGDKGQRGLQQYRRIGNPVCQQRRQEYQCILDPLVQPDRLDPGAYGRLGHTE